MLRGVHYIAISSSIILIAFLYWRENAVPPLKKKASTELSQRGGGTPPVGNTIKAASFDSILAISKAQLPANIADTVNTIEKKLAAIHDSSRMAVFFTQLAGIWERQNQLNMVAYYTAKAAKLDNSEKKLNFAAQIFLQLLPDAGSEPLRIWEAQEAESCFQQVLVIDPNNEDAKLGLATCYIEGLGQPMAGVQLLLSITNEKPDDIPANMLLGRLSIQSGQFDKAIGRFETILKQQPENTEALYFMADAYKGKGNTKKAIELLEECKRIVNKPEFSRDIDKYINSFK